MPLSLPNARPLTPSISTIAGRACAAGRDRFMRRHCSCRSGSATPAAELYAFCREADDVIDGAGCREAGYAVALLRERLDRIYRGDPQNRWQTGPLPPLSSDMIFRARCRRHCSKASRGMRRRAATRRSRTLQQYAARVAGCVGVMMTLVMGRRDPHNAGTRLRSRCRDAVHQYLPRRGRGCARGPCLSAARMAAQGRHRPGPPDRPTGVFAGARRRGPRRARACGPALQARGASHCRAASLLPPGHPCRPRAVCRDRPRDRAAWLRQCLATRGGSATAQARGDVEGSTGARADATRRRHVRFACDAVPARCIACLLQDASQPSRRGIAYAIARSGPSICSSGWNESGGLRCKGSGSAMSLSCTARRGIQMCCRLRVDRIARVAGDDSSRTVRHSQRQRKAHTRLAPFHPGRRGIRNGSIACTQREAKRSSERLS